MPDIPIEAKAALLRLVETIDRFEFQVARGQPYGDDDVWALLGNIRATLHAITNPDKE
jgi:hypothetical protein